MIYVTGEQPKMGDCIEYKDGKRAKVIDVKQSSILIRWDEGVVAFEHPPDDFTLLVTEEQKTVHPR